MLITSQEITVRNGDLVLSEVVKACACEDSIIDFSNVRQVDSTVLAVLLAAKRVLKSDKKLELMNPPAQLDSLIAAYGVQSLFL
jgi:ABC-type transporter Mla MlaB component